MSYLRVVLFFAIARGEDRRVAASAASAGPATSCTLLLVGELKRMPPHQSSRW